MSTSPVAPDPSVADDRDTSSAMTPGRREPTFTLRASDPVAPIVIRNWAYQQRVRILAAKAPPETEDQVADAIATAEAMEAWHRQHKGRG